MIMNFKPNAWTVLFSLTLFALLFNIYGERKTDLVADNDCSKVQPDTISSEQAFDMLISYSTYLASNRALIDSLKTTSNSVENPDVIFFSIPKCELQQMVTSIPGGQVTAYLGIKDNPQSGKPMLDLFFSDKDMSNAFVNGEIDVLASKGAGGERFWDFTSPCPTLCSE